MLIQVLFIFIICFISYKLTKRPTQIQIDENPYKLREIDPKELEYSNTEVKNRPFNSRVNFAEERVNDFLRQRDLSFISNYLLVNSEGFSNEYDHLVFLEGAVVIIETKSWKGDIHCSETNDWRDPNKATRSEWNPHKQITRLQQTLKKELQKKEKTRNLIIYPLIVFIGDEKNIINKLDYIADGLDELGSQLDKICAVHSPAIGSETKEILNSIKERDMSDNEIQVAAHLKRYHETRLRNERLAKEQETEEANEALKNQKENEEKTERILQEAVEAFLKKNYRKNSKSKRPDYFKQISNKEIWLLQEALMKSKEKRE